MPARRNSGPKPKPTSLRTLEGDKNKDRYNLNEPKSGDLDIEDIPEEVRRDPYAIEMWTRLAPKLVNMGLLMDVDYYAFKSLCVTYGLWSLKPSVQMTSKLQSQLSEFGLTPSSRTRLVGRLPHEDSSESAASLMAKNRQRKAG